LNVRTGFLDRGVVILKSFAELRQPDAASKLRDSQESLLVARPLRTATVVPARIARCPARSL